MLDKIYIYTNKVSGVQTLTGLAVLMIGTMRWTFLIENGLNLSSKIPSKFQVLELFSLFYRLQTDIYEVLTLWYFMYFRFSLPIGHYSAMLWSNTNKVGCGLTEYLDGKWFAKLYTCNYAPAGNFINGEMYKIGKPCSKCPRNMKCSPDYPGLCGRKIIYIPFPFHIF